MLTAQALSLFAVPELDREPLRYAAEQAPDDPRFAGWVAEASERMRAAIGRPSPPPPLPGLALLGDSVGWEGEAGEAGAAAYLPVLAYADVLPVTLASAQDRGVPPSVVAATLADVGRMMTRNRRWEGRPGLGDELAGWLTRHLIGSILQVGRLQHERAEAGPRTGIWLREDGAEYVPGDLCVNLHIPETGPLRPEAVRESLRAGRTLLRRRFPQERLRVRFCVSWLLDPQLGEYLPQESNIRAFQELFHIGPAKDDDGDASVRKFVFGNTPAPVDDLPQRTALERAAVAHWRAGRHWRVHVGRIDETRV